MLRRQALRGGEIGKASREDQPVAGADQLRHNAVEIRRRHGFHRGGIDAVAQHFSHAAAPLVVHMGPAEIADRADQDDAHIEARLRLGLLAGQRGASKTGRASHKVTTGDVHEALPEKLGGLSKFNADTEALIGRAQKARRARPAPPRRRALPA